MSLAMDKAAPEPRVGGSAGKGAGGGCHAPRAQRGHSRSRSEPTPPFSTSQSTEQPLKKKGKVDSWQEPWASCPPLAWPR